MFQACYYKGKPAVFDTVAKVFYTCKSMQRAKAWVIELNAGK